MEKRLHLPPERIDRARELASRIVAPVQEFIEAHTTVTVERATLRLAGADGADADGVPVPNLVVDQLRATGSRTGALKYWVNALLRTGEDVAGAEPAGRRRAPPRRPPARRPRGARREGGRARRRPARGACAANRALREERLARYAGKNHAPLLYVIVATGNIHEDVTQAGAPPSRARTSRRYPLHRPEPPRLRPLRRDHRGLRRHLRHPGELPDHAGRAGRGDEKEGRYIRLINYCLRPVHARDRGDGGARAAGHDAQRLDVRHPLPGHQHAPHFRRPVFLPDDQREGRYHHQHRRGQLPDDRRRLEKAHTVLATQFINERSRCPGCRPG